MTRALAAGVIAGLLSSVVPEAATQIAAIAAGTAGIGYLWRRIVTPFIQLIHRALTAYQVLERMPEWMHQVDERFEAADERLDRVEARTAALHEPAEAIARELGVEHRRPA